MVMGGLPRPEGPQVGRRRVPGMGQRWQDVVELCHLDGREVPTHRLDVGGDVLRGGGAGHDATHLEMGQ